jgi:hypothetical protein
MKTLISVAILMATVSLRAEAAPSICDALAKAVDDGVKEMAFYDEAALGTPALEVTNRRLNLVAEASRVQSNLMLMQANKCPMPKDPISPRAYFGSAFACAHAIVKPGTDPIPECDREKWVKKNQ